MGLGSRRGHGSSRAGRAGGVEQEGRGDRKGEGAGCHTDSFSRGVAAAAAAEISRDASAWFALFDDNHVVEIHRLNLSDVDEASRLVNSIESAVSRFRALLT